MSGEVMSKNNKNPQAAIRFKRLDSQALLPEYATPGSAGMDIRASAEVGLGPGKWAAVSTGLSVEIPPGFEIQVRPRSGLAARFGVSVLNSPGTIDSDYRGEIKVILINHGPQEFIIKPGDRIAQLVVARVPTVTIEDVDSLSETSRGSGGLGSTGVA